MTDNTSNVVRSETSPAYRIGPVTETHPATIPSMEPAPHAQPGSNLFLIWFDKDRLPLGTFIIPADWRMSHASLLKASLTCGIKLDAMSALLVHNTRGNDIEANREVSDMARMLRHGFGMVEISLKRAITINSDGTVRTID